MRDPFRLDQKLALKTNSYHFYKGKIWKNLYLIPLCVYYTACAIMHKEIMIKNWLKQTNFSFFSGIKTMETQLAK